MNSESPESTRPRWSVVIPAHNCADYLALTLESVLGQLGNRDDAEIVVVDDGSSDNPKAVVERLGGGRVRFERNETALGAIPNFNRCVSLARGELVHLLHGDDLVLPGFYDAMDIAFEAETVSAAFCRTQHIDGDGNPMSVTRSYVPGGGVWPAALREFASSNRVATPSIVLRASTYERAGAYDESLPHAADWDMWSRAATVGDIYFVDRVLAQYRVHGQNDTSKRLKTGENMSERFAAMEHILQYVPADERPGLRRKGAALATMFAARQTLRQVKGRNWATAGVQAKWALKSLGRVVRD